MALILAAQIFIFARFWSDADLRTTDFPAFHAVGLLAQTGEQPYSLENQCRVEIEVNPSQFCLPFAHPPILLPILTAIASPNYTVSYWRWAIFTTFLLILCAPPLYSLTGSLESTAQSLLFFPAIFGLWMGQDNSIVLLAVLTCFWLLQSNKDFLAGFVLAFGAVKPQLILILAIALLFSRRRAFLGFVTAGAALLVAALAQAGFAGLRGIVDLTLLMSRAQGFGVWPEGMYNLTGILARAGLDLHWAWMGFLIGLAAIAILWQRLGVTKTTFAVAVIVTLFTAPHVHLWDLSLLIIPLFTLHRLAPAIGSLVIVATFPFELTYSVVYLLMVGLLVAHIMNYQSIPVWRPALTPKAEI